MTKLNQHSTSAHSSVNTPEKSGSESSSLAWLALAVMPLFFSSNLIFGRAANSIDPFTLATLRWSISAVIMLIIIRPQWDIALKIAKHHWKLLFLCGFLAMWVCGGLVYLALSHTTATNGTLIYTTPPLIIIILERIFNNRRISWRELSGISIAILGVATIITKGNLLNLSAMEFNQGDLMFVIAAICWALYTMLSRANAFTQAPSRVIFALVATFGTITLIPFTVWELYHSANYPKTQVEWQMVAGLVAFSSLIPFSFYQFGIKVHGATTASVFLYLLPPFGIAMAWAILDEIPNMVTLLGCVFVLGGVIFATAPIGRQRRKT